MKYKVGDKVKIVKVGKEFNPHFKKYIGEIYEIKEADCNEYILDIEGGTFWQNYELELVKPKQFTKSDLKDNHIVVNKKGNKQVWGNKDKDLFNDCLTSKTNDKKTIVEVYEFDKLIWKREEQILDEVEKKYLSDLIRPFRDKVRYIRLINYVNTIKQFISIEIKGDSSIYFPLFKKGTMYKGMEVDKNYSLEDLGL